MNIRHYRIRKGITQSELATRLDIKDRSVVAKWETGKARPKIESLLRLAEVLNCSLEDLLKGEEE